MNSREQESQSVLLPVLKEIFHHKTAWLPFILVVGVMLYNLGTLMQVMLK